MTRAIIIAVALAFAAPAHAGFWSSVKDFFSGNAQYQGPSGTVSKLDTHTKSTHAARLARARYDNSWGIVGGISGNYGTNGCQKSSCQ